MIFQSAESQPTSSSLRASRAVVPGADGRSGTGGGLTLGRAMPADGTGAHGERASA